MYYNYTFAMSASDTSLGMEYSAEPDVRSDFDEEFDADDVDGEHRADTVVDMCTDNIFICGPYADE